MLPRHDDVKWFSLVHLQRYTEVVDGVAPIIRECWETGSFWFFRAINSPKGLCRVFTEKGRDLFTIAGRNSR